MPVIRISDETLRRLKTWAEPLEDTAESAVSKVLDAAEGMSGDRSSQRKFRKPLLRAIYEMGGSARTEDLYPVIRKHIAAVPLSGNMNNLSSGDKEWRNAIRRERHKLVREGCLRDDSPRGTWELSRKGTELVEKMVTEPSESFIRHLLAIPAVGEDADFDRIPSQPRTVKL
ncbi:MAG: hypothetical protein OXK19_05135 [Candidatus Dadabacteria bacterium]|nr:hypothetical protein [Candidatus Dadabacteria bacterium]